MMRARRKDINPVNINNQLTVEGEIVALGARAQQVW
jgi:hypothetical protein